MVARRESRPFRIPTDEDGLDEVLDELPRGFDSDWTTGLGLLYDYRFIADAIAAISGMSALLIHSGNERQAIAPIYSLGEKRLEDIRKRINRITSGHRRQSLKDKNLLTYQVLLHEALPRDYPPRSKRIDSDIFHEAIDVGSARTIVSKRDHSAVLKILHDNAHEIAKSRPGELMSLKSDIELITLGELIQRFKDLMDKARSERDWQLFFQLNPFVLSLAFSVPTMLIQNTPYVGGKRFDGRGGKFSDFLAATKSTGNLLIIEIKKPSTEVLSRSTYRDDLRSLSSDLSGSIVQALDQRLKLQKNIANLKEESDRNDIFTYSVKIVIIAGITPSNGQDKKSWELARNSFSEVVLITFDELLGRLEEIYRVLSPCVLAESDDIPF
jgi:chorismate mutase